MTQQQTGVTPLGKFVSVLLILGLVGVGGYMVLNRNVTTGGEKPSADPSGGSGGSAGGAEVAELKVAVPTLAPPAPYQPKDGTIEFEISEYAGYAGLIAANGGLAPSENSVFFKKHGVKVRLVVSEEESWSKLNSGAIGASVTTVDVLAVYGRQFRVVVPAQVGFSRGADGLIVRNDIKRINALKGKVVATAQFTEVDFFIRYLAQEAGLPIHAMASLDATPSPDAINLVFTETAFDAGDLFLQDIKSGKNKLAGCVTWEPKTSDVVAQSGGQARALTTNRNLLIVGDILIANRGFAEAQPQMVAALAEGLLEGNRMVRDQPTQYVDLVARAFKWTADRARSELSKVHLSNLPENLAFFSGAIDAAGSFNGIYQSAVLAYGSDLIKDPVDSDRFVDLKALKAIEASGLFKDQKVAIAPIKSAGGSGSLENNPLLSKDIRFLFEPNSDKLDLADKANTSNLDAIKQLLQVSPGSTILLRGHVDNARVEEFKKQGDQFLRQMALRAIDLSKRRASEIKRVLVEKYSLDAARLEVVGRGWEEPSSQNSEMNRRVEVQWFTLE